MTNDEKTNRRKNRRSRLWSFLNSGFGIFFFSSVVLSFVTWSYTELSHNNQQRGIARENITKLDTEISYRIRLVENYFASECTDPEKITPKTFMDIQQIYRAKPDYQSIFSENREKGLHTLMWERAALSLKPENKKGFIAAFNDLLNFNASLTKIQSETDSAGLSYGIRSDAEKVKELQEKFSSAIDHIENLPGIETGDRVATPPSVASLTREPLQLSSGKTDEAVTEAIRAPEPLKAPEQSTTSGPLLDQPFLMAIVDVDVTVPGTASWVYGQIERGKVRLGDKLEVVGLDGTITTTVDGLQLFRSLSEEAVAGDFVMLSLAGVARKDLERGQVLAKPQTIWAHTEFTARAHFFTEEDCAQREFTGACRHYKPVAGSYRPQFSFYRKEVPGEVIFPRSENVAEPGDRLEIKVSLERPVAMEKGRQFYLKEGGMVVASGTVVDFL